MSFVSIVRKILGVAMIVEHDAAPLAETLFPSFSPEISAFDSLVTMLTGSIAKQEVQTPNAAGEAKKTAVISDFDSQLKPINNLLQVTGYQVSYDSAALSAATDAFVAAYNQTAVLRQSIVITKTIA
jgi:hypothetical protein